MQTVILSWNDPLFLVGCVSQWAERRSLAGELTARRFVLTNASHAKIAFTYYEVNSLAVSQEAEWRTW